MFDQPNFHKSAYVQVVTRPLLGAVIKMPQNPSEDTYKEPTDLERKIIHEIITTIGRENLATLWSKSNHLEKLGKKIEFLHPLQFLIVIFGNEELKNCMPLIFDTTYTEFRKNGFLYGGLTANLNRESDKGKLKNCLNDFAQKVNIPKEKLEDFFNYRRWEDMIEFMINYAPE